VDYNNITNLAYTLQGANLVISTIGGNEQLNLIDAARRARVNVFVPSEFEGDLNHRPDSDDPLDNRESASALRFLESWSQSTSTSHRLRYTVFSCGVFMERFAPGGLQMYGIGAGCGVQGPDDYLVNIQEARAEIIPTNPNGRPARISMTSVYDVAQFIMAAIELGLDNWPKEFRMRGDSVTVQELVETCSNALGGSFPPPPVSLCFLQKKILTHHRSLDPPRHPPLPRSRGTGRSQPTGRRLVAVLLLPAAAPDRQRALPRAPAQPQRSHPGAAPDVPAVAGECLGFRRLNTTLKQMYFSALPMILSLRGRHGCAATLSFLVLFFSCPDIPVAHLFMLFPFFPSRACSKYHVRSKSRTIRTLWVKPWHSIAYQNILFWTFFNCVALLAVSPAAGCCRRRNNPRLLSPAECLLPTPLVWWLMRPPGPEPAESKRHRV